MHPVSFVSAWQRPAVTAPTGKGAYAMKQLHQTLFGLSPGFTQALILCLVWLLMFFTLPAFAQDKSQPPDTELSVEIGSGLHFFNVSGYRGKVGEYDVLKSGADSTFSVLGRQGKNYFDLNGQFFADDDQKYSFNVDIQRLFQTAFSYKKFIHYLDHDSLSNQDSYTDYNAGQDNHIVIEELKSGNTLRIPQLPFLKLKMNYRSYAKRGTRQATTVSKCSECHVSSRNQRINNQVNDIAFGFEGTVGPATLQYMRHWISFNQNGTAPVNNYGDGASFFLVKGSSPYGLIPETYTSIHDIRVRTQLPLSSSLFASYQTGEKSNRDSDYDIDYHNFAARLSNYLLKYFTVDTFYNQYRMENSTPNAIDRNYKRGGFDVGTAFKKQFNLKLSYIWENIDRDNFYVNYTRKKTFRLMGNYRVLRKLRFHFKYEKTRVGDPFVTENTFTTPGMNLPGLTETMLPQSTDLFYSSLSWSIRQNLTLNSSFRYLTGKNDRYQVDTDLSEFNFSIWYVPVEKITLTGSYLISVSNIDTPVSYKRYHSYDLSSLFQYDDIPYDAENQVYSLTMSYLLNYKVSLTGEVTYTRSSSDFDSYLNSQNIGNLSDLKINRLDTALGVTYLYSSRLTLSAKYMFREYNDKNDNAFDGQFNGVSVGLNWLLK